MPAEVDVPATVVSSRCAVLNYPPAERSPDTRAERNGARGGDGYTFDWPDTGRCSLV
ncbi:MAG: hypothetical protein ACKO0Z_08625 [Betaproteobacteria bacterium]